MLDFLTHVVQEHVLERLIVAIVGALTISVGGFQLFHQ